MYKIKLYLFQSAPNLAGAQKSLTRLATSGPLRFYEPTVFISEPGWLSEFCEENKVRYHIVRSPGPRKLVSRFFGNGCYADRIAGIIRSETGNEKLILHGNDLLEATPIINIAKRVGAKTVLTLRTPGMSRRDFEKYRCDHVNMIAVVGSDLCRKVEGWARNTPVKLVHNGLRKEEFFPLKLDKRQKPEKIVVLGGSQPRKGWSDLLQALERLNSENLGVKPEFSFLGESHGLNMGEFFKKYHPSRRFVCRHLPRTPAFVETLRQYHLAIQPSRSECHGMAALEAIAAGLPLISTKTGDIDAVLSNKWLCETKNPASLAQVLTEILQDWANVHCDCISMQQKVRETVNIDVTGETYSRMYQALTS